MLRRLAAWYLLRGYASNDPLRVEMHDLRLRNRRQWWEISHLRIQNIVSKVRRYS